MNVSSVPTEFPIIKREHFNGWYSAIAYYTSLILADFSIILLNVSIYTAIVYLLTDQPRELHRYLLYFGFHLIFAYDAQTLAIMVTSLFKGLASYNLLLIFIYFFNFIFFISTGSSVHFTNFYTPFLCSFYSCNFCT